MTKFLTTLETSAKIEKIIRQAKEELTLITPYLKLTQIFHDRLVDAGSRNIKIKLIYGKEELNPEDLERLNELKNLELYFCENLHAKCYFNENLMVISSMNLHEFSQTNNREMGVQIKLEEDAALFNDAKNEAISIIKASVKETSESKISNLEENKEKYQDKGYCIRCKTEIDFNPQRPLCRLCYNVWIKFAEPYYQEKFCHKCGREFATTYAHPLCKICWQKNIH
jgi:phosphatidylserine/phosphatidylglycerophosphate/cardiolipin synthase-like enzyme